MSIVINIIWSILLIPICLGLIYFFEEVFDSEHKFISLMATCLGMTLIIRNPQVFAGTAENFLVWLLLFIVYCLFADTFIGPFILSFQITTDCAIALNFLPKFAYTWAPYITRYTLSKIGAVVYIVFIILFLVGLAQGGTDKQKSAPETADSDLTPSTDTFSFASSYATYPDESIYYTLVSHGSDYGIIKDEEGNHIKVIVHNKSENSLIDQAGNIYYPR